MNEEEYQSKLRSLKTRRGRARGKLRKCETLAEKVAQLKIIRELETEGRNLLLNRFEAAVLRLSEAA